MRGAAHTAVYAADPVLWSREVCQWEPDPWQAKLLRSAAQNLLVNCSRQSGKTTTAAVLSAHCATFMKEATVVVLSPVQRQAALLLRQTKSFFRMASDERLLRNNVYDFETSEGSRVITLPGDEDTIRGVASVDLLLLDEAARIPDELYLTVVPMLAVSRGRQLALSTPKGKRGWWWDAWRGEDGETWETYEVPWQKCPRFDAEQIKRFRIKFGPTRFAQEFECTFNTMEGMLFDPDDVAAAFSQEVDVWDPEADEDDD